MCCRRLHRCWRREASRISYDPKDPAEVRMPCKIKPMRQSLKDTHGIDDGKESPLEKELSQIWIV
jgi:hypothetical protein